MDSGGTQRTDRGSRRRTAAVTVGLLLAVVVAGTGLAATGDAGIRSQQADSRITGEVETSAGDPVAGEDVRIVDLDTGGTVATVRTRSDGSFGPVELEPGNYTAEVADPAYESFATRVRLEPGEVEHISVTVERRTGRIRGEVQNQNGTAVGGVEVAIRDVDAGTTVATVTTRSDGSFGPMDLPAGANYTARVDRPGRVDFATVVHLGANEAQTIQVTLDRARGSLKGTVRETDADPVAGVDVAFYLQHNGTRMATVTTRSDGSFGPVELPAEAEFVVNVDEPAWAEFATAVALDDGETKSVPVTLRRTAGSLEGTVANDGGDPVAGATVRVTNATNGTTVHTPTTAADGSWGPVLVEPGAWAVSAAAPGHAPASTTVQVGESASVALALDRLLELSAPSADGPVRTDEELAVEVTVSNPSTAERSTDLVLSVAGTERATKGVTVAAGGSRTATLRTGLSVGPGDYVVRVATGNRSVTTTVAVTGTPTATATPTPSATPSPTRTPTSTATPTSGDGASGFTAAVALGALAALGLAGRRRR